MGRFYYESIKTTVEQSTELCIFRLKKWGLLQGYCRTSLTWTRRLSGSVSSADIVVDATCERHYIRLMYTIKRCRDGSKEYYDYEVRLAKTPCNFGSFRYWFLCPHCERRSGKLYRKPLGEMYLCRTCNDLTYESRNESRIGRPGGIGYYLTLERRIEELQEKAKRRTWRGRPTRKMRRIAELEKAI